MIRICLYVCNLPLLISYGIYRQTIISSYNSLSLRFHYLIIRSTSYHHHTFPFFTLAAFVLSLYPPRHYSLSLSVLSYSSCQLFHLYLVGTSISTNFYIFFSAHVIVLPKPLYFLSLSIQLQNTLVLSLPILTCTIYCILMHRSLPSSFP